MCHLPHITRSHQGHDPEVQQRQQDPQESVCQVTLFTFCVLEKFREESSTEVQDVECSVILLGR